MIDWTVDRPDGPVVLFIQTPDVLTALGAVMFVWEADSDAAWFEWCLSSNSSNASAAWQMVAEPMLELQVLGPSTSYSLSVRAVSVGSVSGTSITYEWTMSACPASLPVIDASISMMS